MMNVFEKEKIPYAENIVNMKREIFNLVFRYEKKAMKMGIAIEAAHLLGFDVLPVKRYNSFILVPSPTDCKLVKYIISKNLCSVSMIKKILKNRHNIKANEVKFFSVIEIKYSFA
jgi:hypothetical protein